MKLFLLCGCVALMACGDDDRGRRDAGPSQDSAVDARASDGAIGDAPPGVDALFDGGAPDAIADAPPGVDASSSATVELTFAGCSPDFSGDTVVVRNADSIAVSSTRGGALVGSIQLALQGERGAVTLGTQHRVDTGAVINIVVSTTWTNIAMDSGAVLSGESPDPIGGSLRIDAYDEGAGVMDISFEGVTLQNPSDGSICRVDGRLQTSGLSF